MLLCHATVRNGVDTQMQRKSSMFVSSRKLHALDGSSITSSTEWPNSVDRIDSLRTLMVDEPMEDHSPEARQLRD